MRDKLYVHIAVVGLLLCAFSCGDLKGQLGFKTIHDDTYRQKEGTPEFAADEEVQWVYVFKKKIPENHIGIVYLKKELVWVEVLTDTARIDKDNRAVYGTIKDLAPGEYQLVFTELKNDNKLIESKDFVIYEKENDDE